MKPEELKIGLEVGYDCIPALMSYRGKIVSIGAEPNGADCKIAWNHRQHLGASSECAQSLRKWD